jgi:hypothetical protein
MNTIYEIYKNFADSKDIKYDNKVIELLQKENYKEAFLYSYENDMVQVFKYLYLYGNVRFPIQMILDINTKIEENSGKTYKVNWDKGIELELVNLVCNKKVKEELKYKLDMVIFIMKCRAYSKHVFDMGRFYYIFNHKYDDEIESLL